MSTERNEKQMTKERKIMKRKILAIMLSSMLAFSFTACGNTEETADGTVTNAEADVDVADTGTDAETDAAENDAADIVVDTEAADAQSEDVETDSLNEEKIWSLLQEKSVITPECGMNSFKVNEEEKTIDLDVDEGFGNYIRSMGTTGETEVLACVVNTYLDSFQCEKIKITEAGRTFETSGAVLAGYMTKQ